MESKQIDQLADLLDRLNKGENPQTVKLEAQQFLSTISPEELSYAEQKLIEAGLPAEELRHLCVAHMEMLGDEFERMRNELEPGNVVHTMVLEHDEILDFLCRLEELDTLIQTWNELKKDSDEFKTLKSISEHLLAAESHHEREEEVLFPELEARGITGPPRIMRMEHNDLRKRKKALKHLVQSAEDYKLMEFKKQLHTIAAFLVPTLRDHIFKENNILYPTAVQTIKDESVWKRMKDESDKIGYCCFTPEV